MTPDGPRVAHHRDDRGSASIWVLGVGLATVLAALAVATAAGVLVARQRAQAAADLGALAGARHALAGEATACRYAARIVEANGAIMERCRLTGLDLTITVSAATSGPDGPLPARGPRRRHAERHRGSCRRRRRRSRQLPRSRDAVPGRWDARERGAREEIRVATSPAGRVDG